MKNIVVLHSLNGDTLEFWGKHLKEKFASETEVVMPKFPIRAESSYLKFEEIMQGLLKDGTLNKESIVVAHSIGNAYFVRFAAKHWFSPKHYFAVAPGAVYEYPSTRNDYIVEVKKQAYLKPEELEHIKANLDGVTCLFSDEDDGNSEKFSRFVEDTGSEPIYLKGYNHFDGYHRIYMIPELEEMIEQKLKED